ncbi:hypothetical protein E3N88_31352 [Mikania micrantha]|uniref:Uncharacterized protein n=1 Tax=Mikania micrantha TaxID=192012 RepID=A0A5N6MPS6_9ASTR|nr:hypothetical protein E3N88_31352 [Mikania micrantha]
MPLFLFSIVCCDYHRDDHELLRKSFSLNSFGYSTSSVIAENEKSRTLLNELENQSNVVWCDQMCFSEIMKEASDIGCCFSSRIRHLVHLNSTTEESKGGNLPSPRIRISICPFDITTSSSRISSSSSLTETHLQQVVRVKNKKNTVSAMVGYDGEGSEE